jgi:hypothetical protein
MVSKAGGERDLAACAVLAALHPSFLAGKDALEWQA